MDEQEVKIIRELIKDPRISDNRISKATKVPVMTVNRKRKKLEEKGMLDYFTAVNISCAGCLRARELYIIKFRIGLTQKDFIIKIEADSRIKAFYAKHIEFSFLGEKDGHLALAIIVTASTEQELMDVFNGRIIPFFKENFGNDSIQDVTAISISMPIRLHHNYLPSINMENGKIKKGWKNEWIFTGKPDEKEFGQKKIQQFSRTK